MSIEDSGRKSGNQKAVVVAEALDTANGKILENNKSPQRTIGELDNRGSHFYLALYWAQALADQSKDRGLKQKFGNVARTLAANEARIVSELTAVQGKPVTLGGYYHPDTKLTSAAMRPSATLNKTIDGIG